MLNNIKKMGGKLIRWAIYETIKQDVNFLSLPPSNTYIFQLWCVNSFWAILFNIIQESPCLINNPRHAFWRWPKRNIFNGIFHDESQIKLQIVEKLKFFANSIKERCSHKVSVNQIKKWRDPRAKWQENPLTNLKTYRWGVPRVNNKEIWDTPNSSM